MKLTYTYADNTDYLTQEYDAFDAKGRRIGASARLGEAVVERAEGTVYHFEGDESLIGTRYYTFRPWALRDGRTFGAVQHERHFATKAERQAAINQYFTDAQKRATRRTTTNQEG